MPERVMIACARSLVARHLSTERKAQIYRSSDNFSESNLHKRYDMVLESRAGGRTSQMPHQVTYDAIATSIRPTNA
eukprot:scaffold4954_cov93-Skeletonema_dohrnii-CCMP3373.AAC.3